MLFPFWHPTCPLRRREDRGRLAINWGWLQQRKQYRDAYVALHKRKQYVEWLPPLDDFEEVRIPT